MSQCQTISSPGLRAHHASTAANPARSGEQAGTCLPATGYVRLPTVAAVSGIGRSTIWKWCAQGRMPAPVKLSPRVSAWQVAALRDWLADPAGWQAAQAAKVTA